MANDVLLAYQREFFAAVAEPITEHRNDLHALIRRTIERVFSALNDPNAVLYTQRNWFHTAPDPRKVHFHIDNGVLEVSTNDGGFYSTEDASHVVGRAVRRIASVRVDSVRLTQIVESPLDEYLTHLEWLMLYYRNELTVLNAYGDMSWVVRDDQIHITHRRDGGGVTGLVLIDIPTD